LVDPWLRLVRSEMQRVASTKTRSRSAGAAWRFCKLWAPVSDDSCERRVPEFNSVGVDDMKSKLDSINGLLW
jgi:hypothetical protein